MNRSAVSERLNVETKRPRSSKPQPESAAAALSYLSSDEGVVVPQPGPQDDRGVTKHMMSDAGEYTIHVKAPKHRHGRVEIQVHPRYTSPGSNKIQIRRHRESKDALQGVMRWDLDTPAEGDIVRIMHLAMIALMQTTKAKVLTILVDRQRADVHAQMGFQIKEAKEGQLVTTLEMRNDGALREHVEPAIANTSKLKSCVKDIRQLFGEVGTY